MVQDITVCSHSIQAKVDIIIENNFEPEFRYKDSNSLQCGRLDVLNEGIRCI